MSISDRYRLLQRQLDFFTPWIARFLEPAPGTITRQLAEPVADANLTAAAAQALAIPDD